jgi:selenocysteine-specific elongation factor
MSGSRNIMLGTAGHVDHGKTALVKMLTGCDTDTLPAEKQRGLTIELGFAPCRMRDERIVGIVDVPGHVDFIRNMVAGAQGVDVVLFVVAADDRVMPQTREHLDILTLMGVRRGLIALTKIDLVDAAMRRRAADEVRRFVRGTFLESAPICPVSNITGEGFEALGDALNAAADACPPRPCEGLFRLWVERVFPVRGFGMVVSGIPAGGQVRPGDRVQAIPSGQVGRVRRLEVYGQEASVGRAGECVALNLADLEPEAVGRGVLLAAEGTCEPVTMLEAQLTLLSRLPGAMKDRSEVHVHLGTAEAMADVCLLGEGLLEPGAAALVQLRLRKPLGAVIGERFMIRGSLGSLAEGRVTTLGGGRVVGVSDRRLRKGRSWVIDHLSAVAANLDDPPGLAGALLRQMDQGCPAEALARRAHLPVDRLLEAIQPLRANGTVLTTATGELVHAEAAERLCAKLVEMLGQFHQANPLRLGIEPDQFAAQAELRKDLLAMVLEILQNRGAVVRQGPVLALAGRSVEAPAPLAEACQALEQALRDSRLEPPLPAELGTRLGLPPRRLEQAIRLLSDRGQVVPLDAKVVMHRQAVEAAQDVVLRLFGKAGSFTTMQYRDALGVSRKYAVPLLDYFDRQRLTVRGGNRRTPGLAAKALLQAKAGPSEPKQAR